MTIELRFDGSVAHEIADSFVGLGGDVDEGELAGPEVPGELDGVPAVMFAFVTWTFGDERGRSELA